MLCANTGYRLFRPANTLNQVQTEAALLKVVQPSQLAAGYFQQLFVCAAAIF
jgi:hypothetical protein